MDTAINISDAARVLSTIDTELQELEADLRALGRQKSNLERRETEVHARIETLRELAIKVMTKVTF